MGYAAISRVVGAGHRQHGVGTVTANVRVLVMAALLATLSACGSGGRDGREDGGPLAPPPPPAPPALPAAPTLSMTLSAVKRFDFSWAAVAGATSYNLLENPDGASGFTAIAGASGLTGTSYTHVVALYRRVNARYIVQACNAGGCTDSAAFAVSGNLGAAIGYFKASNTGTSDQFGVYGTVALSADGMTLAVGAMDEDSNATGIGGNQGDNTAVSSGAVYVY